MLRAKCMKVRSIRAGSNPAGSRGAKGGGLIRSCNLLLEPIAIIVEPCKTYNTQFPYKDYFVNCCNFECKTKKVWGRYFKTQPDLNRYDFSQKQFSKPSEMTLSMSFPYLEKDMIQLKLCDKMDVIECMKPLAHRLGDHKRKQWSRRWVSDRDSNVTLLWIEM